MRTLMHMKESSTSDVPAFRNTELKNLAVLIAALSDTALTNVEHIKSIYVKSGVDFEETLAFSNTLGISKVDGDKILKSYRFQEAVELIKNGNRHLGERTISWALSSNSVYGKEVRKVLDNAAPDEDGAWKLKRLASGSALAHARNYLIEIGLISMDYDDMSYTLDIKLEDLLLTHGILSGQHPDQLEEELSAQKLVGNAAEKLVFEHEKSEAGAQLTSFVKHVAIENCSAGFDILSIRKDERGGTTKRYIEVKAVNSRDFTFYWSENERKVAGMLGSYYYLYLVPVCDGKPKIEQMEIIPNPIKNVIENTEQWSKEPYVLECRKIKNATP